MASLRRLLIPTALAVSFVSTPIVACGSDDDDDDPTVGPIPGTIDASIPGDGGDGDGGDTDAGSIDATPMPDSPPDAEPDAPVG